MRNFYALAVLFITMHLNAQTEYHLFQPETQYLFNNQSIFVDETNSRTVGMKVGQNECTELYRTILVEQVPPNPLTSDKRLIVPSFAGLSICQTAEVIRMEVGKENAVVIRQHTGLGESWDVTVEDGILVTGRVDSIQEVAIDGVLDSVKFINFFKGDTLLLERPVELSKANGLLRGAYFWGLLTMPETLDRTDSGEVPLPGWEEFHDFAVGDEYHVESVDYTSNDVGDLVYIVEQEIFRVVSVMNSNGARSVGYSSDMLTYSTTDYYERSDAADSVLVLDRSIQRSYEVDSPSWVNYQPGANTGAVAFLGMESIVQLTGSCFGMGKRELIRMGLVLCTPTRITGLT